MLVLFFWFRLQRTGPQLSGAPAPRGIFSAPSPTVLPILTAACLTTLLPVHLLCNTGMDFYVVLERPGYRVARRRKQLAKVGAGRVGVAPGCLGRVVCVGAAAIPCGCASHGKPCYAEHVLHVPNTSCQLCAARQPQCACAEERVLCRRRPPEPHSRC